jgi:murein DD-endopeptidase MepM/ murein hydrolase activator NlpD
VKNFFTSMAALAIVVYFVLGSLDVAVYANFLKARTAQAQGGWVVVVAGKQYQVRVGRQAEVQAEPQSQVSQLDLSQLGDQERVKWSLDLLNALGNPEPTIETVAYVIAWTMAEDRGTDAFNRNNPLNTTQTSDTVTMVVNGDGVKGYQTRQDGIEMTVKTLGYDFSGYEDIRQGLIENDPERALRGLYASPWGTNAVHVEQIFRNEMMPRLSMQQSSVSGKCPVTQPTVINAHFSDTNSEYWVGQVGGMHNGTDFGGDPGTPVYAPFDMTIEDIQFYSDPGRIGWYIQGRLADGYLFYAGHLGTTTVQVGQHIVACTQIGTIGEVYHSHIKIAPPEAPVPCEIYARPDGSPWCEDFETYFANH